MEQDYIKVAKTMQAFSDPKRLLILDMHSCGERCAGELQEALSMTQAKYYGLPKFQIIPPISLRLRQPPAIQLQIYFCVHTAHLILLAFLISGQYIGNPGANVYFSQTLTPGLPIVRTSSSVYDEITRERRIYERPRPFENFNNIIGGKVLWTLYFLHSLDRAYGQSCKRFCS